jgi:hypothetical protein
MSAPDQNSKDVRSRFAWATADDRASARTWKAVASFLAISVVLGFGLAARPAGASGALSSSPVISFVSPSPAEGATTLTTSAVRFAFTYNRTPKQTTSVACTLAGPTSSSGPCDAPVAAGTGSASAKSYSGLAAGSYTFSVTLTLTDGGHASATRHFTVVKAPQTISFTAPASGTYGGSDTLSATGGPSGNPVVFSVDQSSDAGVCSVSGTNGTTVNYAGVGNCVIDANQAGSAVYAAAAQVRGTIAVGKAPQTISFTAPASGTYGGSDTLSASGGPSGNPVVFSVDQSSDAGVCSVSGTNGTTVNYNGAGSCVIDANQQGSNDFLPAAQVQQTVTVSAPSTLLPAIPVIDIDFAFDPQIAVVPPQDVSHCPSPDANNGGCAINELDGTIDNTFDASNSVDPNINPSQDQVQYHWQIFYPPVFGSQVVYTSAGITGYHSPVLHIVAGALPQLDGDPRVGSDIFWRVELTITITTPHGTIGQVVFFRFAYSSAFSLQISSSCQLTGFFMGTDCALIASQLLPATETV